MALRANNNNPNLSTEKSENFNIIDQYTSRKIDISLPTPDKQKEATKKKNATQPFRLPNINFQKKSGNTKDKNENESPDQKRERKVFQSVCDTYQKIVYEAENKVFATAVKLPARRQKLRVGFDKDKGYQI